MRVPAESDLAKLPREAVELFSRRCLERIETLFRIRHGGEPIEGISEWRQFKQLGDTGGADPGVAQLLAASAAFQAQALAYERAGYTLLRKFLPGNGESPANPIRNVADPSESAELSSRAIRPIWRDYQNLRKFASQPERPDTNASPDSSILGPLWPQGTPDGWPEALRARAFDSEEEESQVIYISPWAYLRAMANIAWSAFRHPFTTTVIDLTTGRVVESSH